MGNVGKRGTAGRAQAGNGGQAAVWRKERPPQTARRVTKRHIVERIQRDTQEVRNDSLLSTLRKQGYEELPLEEIQDRLSKLRTALAEFITSRRI
jgi:hypothetical protein